MHNNLLEKRIEETKKSLLNDLIDDKERELRQMELALSLSEYSTTQLKAELRRRKNKR